MNYINTLQEALLRIHSKSRISDIYMFVEKSVLGTQQEYEYLCKVEFLHPDLSWCHPRQSSQRLTKKAAKQEAACLALSALPLIYTQKDPVEYMKTTIRNLSEKVSYLESENTALRQQVERLMHGNNILYSKLESQ